MPEKQAAAGSVTSAAAERRPAAPSGAVPAARTALVTGASRGIGRRIALGLVGAGLDVALLARDEARLAAVAQEAAAAGAVVLPVDAMPGSGATGAGRLGPGVSAGDADQVSTADPIPGRAPRVLTLAADVTSSSAVAAAVARAEAELGGTDLLVNNAGRLESEAPLWEADPDDWWATFEANVRGVFLLNRHVVPGMLSRGGGRIIDLASGASTHEGPWGHSAYNASKTALVRMGAVLHGEGFARGLRVFELAPGVVRTEMSTALTIHANRTEWTPPSRVTDLVNAIAGGGLDDCSGWLLRATHDTPESLRELVRAAERADAEPATARRRLRIVPAGGDDPLADLFVSR